MILNSDQSPIVSNSLRYCLHRNPCYYLFTEKMESTSGRELVTVVSVDYGVGHGGMSEVDRYAMAEEPVDYTQEWGGF